MKGFPKYLNSKADIINVIKEDLDRPKTRAALQALINTSTRQEPVWPEGYDPNNPPTTGETVQPIGWAEVANPGGSIFLLGLSIPAVNGLIEVIDFLYPLRDKVRQIDEFIKTGQLEEAEAVRASLADFPFSPSVGMSTVFILTDRINTNEDDPSLYYALTNPDRDLAQEDADIIIRRIEEKLELIIASRLNLI